MRKVLLFLLLASMVLGCNLGLEENEQPFQGVAPQSVRLNGQAIPKNSFYITQQGDSLCLQLQLVDEEQVERVMVRVEKAPIWLEYFSPKPRSLASQWFLHPGNEMASPKICLASDSLDWPGLYKVRIQSYDNAGNGSPVDSFDWWVNNANKVYPKLNGADFDGISAEELNTFDAEEDTLRIERGVQKGVSIKYLRWSVYPKGQPERPLSGFPDTLPPNPGQFWESFVQKAYPLDTFQLPADSLYTLELESQTKAGFGIRGKLDLKISH